MTAITSQRQGLQRVEVDGEAAYVVTALIGPVAVGDEVVVNTTAVDLGLGTGGSHVVHWNLARREWRQAGPGHVMKLRYTSLQSDTGCAEELDGSLAEADELDGTPVVVCPLHSQVPAVAAAFAAGAPDRRLGYVMTDSASLPLALSELVADLRRRRLLAVTVTSGQAFGGDLEAVNAHSALVAARRAGGADAVVVAPGPGVVGTATRLGFSALEVGPLLDAVEVLGGRPVAVPRWSDSDERPRHQGVSHHTVTALTRVTRARATIALPDGAVADAVRPALEREGVAERHRLIRVESIDVAALAADHGLDLRTMGRRLDQEPTFFALAAAAGALAAEWCR